jgi:SAM-dependent methyltransferase
MGGTEVHTDTRTAGLEALRRENYRVILDELASLRSLKGATVLDVGSAHGWFLEEVIRRGATGIGIEPDERVASHSAGEVRVGLFPDSLLPGERFDVIAFNDVLEHIVDVPAALDACCEHLRPRGLLSVNIPTADGFAFRMACRLARLRISGPYRRLWQHGLPSPHQHYFSTHAMVTLIGHHGFVIRNVREMRAVTRKGLWQRVHTVQRKSPASLISFASLYIAAGLLSRRGASDIIHVVAQAPPDP